jgi:hypothetical protein
MERPKGAFCYYQGASFGAPSPLKAEGRKDKTQLARRREDESAWLFEIMNQKFDKARNILCVIRGLAVFAKASPA